MTNILTLKLQQPIPDKLNALVIVLKFGEEGSELKK
jgi:hypothetical protein